MMEQNLTLDPKKVNTIKLRILELETENIVKTKQTAKIIDKSFEVFFIKTSPYFLLFLKQQILGAIIQ